MTIYRLTFSSKPEFKEDFVNFGDAITKASILVGHPDRHELEDDGAWVHDVPGDRLFIAGHDGNEFAIEQID